MPFCEKISAYYSENKRDLPWRKTKEPYKIWLSEIIMQQTKISQGTDYYLKFIKKYPTVFDLANAEEHDILLMWQGLGYYSRARNLHHTAKKIVGSFQGLFPDDYNALLQLKGIGNYTASAVLSICFNKSYPAVDGNVLRVISRIFNISEPVNQSSGKKLISKKCKSLICNDNPGDFNQGLMDFGSMQCTVLNPNCETCLFKNECRTFQAGTVSEIPVKIKAKTKIKEYYHYFLIVRKDEIIIQKRTAGIWKNLYEFPVITIQKKASKKELRERVNEKLNSVQQLTFREVSCSIKHVLSHRILFVTFYLIRIPDKNTFDAVSNSENYIKIKLKDILKYPFPQVIRTFLSNNPLK